MNRVLVIAYAFPPSGGAGVQRTTKFVQYFPEYGWLPTVLTVIPSCYGVQDASQATTLPDEIEVIRTLHFDPVARFSRAPATPNQYGSNGANSPARSSVRQVLRSLARWGWVALERNVFIPDQAILWCPSAVAAGLVAHRRQRFDLIYATGEPYSDYVTATILSRLTGVPFVVDMRDPWTLAPYRSENHTSMRQALERWQERCVLARCRACIFANRAIDLYSEVFPQWASKFHYIPNGYDSTDFAGVKPERFDKFTIVHSGTFLPGYRTADTFLHALREILTTQPDLSERVQVLFVGKIGAERTLIDELSLGHTVRHTGYVPHRESIGYLQGADVLLLVGGRHRWEETSKVYEYLATGKPVLALVHPDGAAAALLRRYPAACIVNRENVSEMRTALIGVLQQGHLDGHTTNPSWVVEFERKQLTGRLAQVLNACL